MQAAFAVSFDESSSAIERAPVSEARAAYLSIAAVATAALCTISWIPRDGPVNYRYAWLFLVPVVWLVYFGRRRLDLIPLHFALFASAVVLHDFGAFGFYQRSFAGLEFDHYVHFYFGFVGGWYAARGLTRRFGLRGFEHAFAVVLLITGVGGIHEIIEGLSTMALGPEHGMLKSDGNPFDTQEDLLNNVLGSLTGCAAWAMQRRAQRRERAD